MFIPVTKIKQILDSLVSFIKADYELAIGDAGEEESFLYRVLYGNTLEDFDFYEQGKDIFIRSGTSSRKLDIRMGFDISRANFPCVYVHQPSESMKGVNTIGFGYDTNQFYDNADETQTDILFRGFGSIFEWIVVSSNVLETILIYEVLHAALISSIDSFTEEFLNISFTGKELIARSDSMPDPMFLKSIQLEVEYIKEVPRLVRQEVVNYVEFNNPIIYGESIGSEIL